MNKLITILIIGFLITGCKFKSDEKKVTAEKVEFNQDLAEELEKLGEVDEIAGFIPQGEYKKLTDAEWSSFKDSVFITHQKRISEIFNEYGFVGYDLVGKEASDSFWAMVQHSDHLPEFQTKVLEQMKKHVEKGNATPEYYAYLVDRVNINIGKEQVYGTQFTYNELGQAFPKNISDTTGIDRRRKSLGLTPIVERMNEMTISNFIFNKEYFEKKGITEPNLYKKE